MVDHVRRLSHRHTFGNDVPMAMDLSSPPASLGLTSQVATLTEQVGAFVADLVPDTLLGADAASHYADFARMERLVMAGKTLLAARIANSSHWEIAGYRSAASLLADIEGVAALYGSSFRQVRPSGPKAAELTEAATLYRRAETLLLAGSEHELLQATKERCQRFKATSSACDPLATTRRIHAHRSFAHWTDPGGTFCYRGSDTPDRGWPASSLWPTVCGAPGGRQLPTRVMARSTSQPCLSG
jgi:hypothetical protein